MEVQRHSSGIGAWEFVRSPAAAPLRGHVRGYCGYVERSLRPVRRKEIAAPHVTLIISLGPAIEVTMDPADPSRRPQRCTSFLAGASDVPAVTEYDGEQRGIEVDLTPIAARRLFGVPMSEVSNRVVGLEDLLGRYAGELVERLAEADGWEARFTLLDAVFATRLSESAEPPPEIVGAWSRLRATHGAVAVAALAAEAGWSHRHLTRRFHDHVGLSPKVFARILRFERVVGLLTRDDGTRLAEIAYACGFADQAHLNREFRALAGDTPSGFLARRLPDGGGVAA